MKPKQKQEVAQNEAPKSTLLPNGDYVELCRLMKVANAQQSDLDSIYTLYKRYINTNAGMYRVGCSCSNSITKYYEDLRNWFSANREKFDQQ
jgi:hypothetical protein